jgi:hypothetical protein
MEEKNDFSLKLNDFRYTYGEPYGTKDFSMSFTPDGKTLLLTGGERSWIFGYRIR